MGTLTRHAITELLHSHGIIPTPQRVQIAMIMLDRFQHLSAAQILAKVNQDGPVVSKATVYNTLGLFAKRGIIRQVIIDSTKVLYDSNTTPHYHFYNLDESTITDFSTDRLQISGIPEPPEGTVADGIDVIVRLRNKANAG